MDQQGQEKDVLPQHFFQYFGARLVKAGQVTLVQFGREEHRVRLFKHSKYRYYFIYNI